MKVFMGVSGGLDSGVLVHSLLLQDREVVGVSFGYGQKHQTFEGHASVSLAAGFSVEFPGRYARLDCFAAPMFNPGTSALLRNGGDLPTGHYADPVMKQTVVPGRNMVFISILAGMAEAAGGGEVVLGIHAGDHEIYPDCRPRFVDSMDQAVRYASGDKVRVFAPFRELSKMDIVKVGLANKFPFHLTRTCYTSNRLACGRCGSCQERLEAFALCGEADPLAYATRDLIPKG